MAFKRHLCQLAVATMLLNPAWGQTVVGSRYDDPTAGPPGSYFAAATTMPVAALVSAVAKASKVPQSAAFPINDSKSPPTATIHADFASLSTAAAYVFVADMDVDCDGLDELCKGNGDGEKHTNFGTLAAYEVPWAVIPAHFYQLHKSELSGNNIVAVICDGKMYYGVFADTDGDNPEVIGEASWLMARTCFPADDLNGNKGHVPADVTYIFFTGDDSVLPSSALGNNYLTDFTKLRSMGDNLVNAFASQLDIATATTASKTTTTSETTTTRKTTTATAPTTTPTSVASCDWAGHCAGDPCTSDSMCDDPWSCVNGYCNYDPTATCQWDGHCLDAVCSVNGDCSDPWACINGVCAVDPSMSCDWEGHCAGATCYTDDDCDNPWSCVYGVCATEDSD